MKNVFLVTAGKVHAIFFLISWESLNRKNRIMQAYSMHIYFSRKVILRAFRFSLKVKKIYLCMNLISIRNVKFIYFFMSKEKYVHS